MGGLNFAAVDPKMLFAGLLLIGAVSFVLVHNHPSGDLQPSAHDVEMTRQIHAAAKTLAIQMLDHIIVSGAGHYSFAAAGRMPR
jgi:DNA repair protein RadC